MKILSLLAHPRSDSFCHALSEHARRILLEQGHEVLHHDLYAERFDPCLTAEEAYTVGDTFEQALTRATDPVLQMHRDEIRTVDGLLVVHPNWWGKPPAILAGWLDRVLVPGVAYRLKKADGLPEPLLSVQSALIINTSDTHAEREKNDLGDPLEAIWGSCVLPYCGVANYRRHVVRPVVDASFETRRQWLSDVEVLAAKMFDGS